VTPQSPPELSVLVATHNRREMLSRCLDSLAGQTQDPATFEVIVADDGSDDGTAKIAEEMRTPFRLRVLGLEKGGQAVALNSAIEAAAGRVCLFLDDDIVASPDLVAEHLAAHVAEPNVLGIGALTQKPPADGDWFTQAYARAWNKRYEELPDREPDWVDCYSGNFSAPRDTLLELGGFSTDLAAVYDIELAYRLCQAGCVPRYLAPAHGVHDDGKGRDRLLAATRGYGAFCAAFTSSHPDTASRLIGWFRHTTPREQLLRRLLLALRVPPRALAPLGAALRGDGPRQTWFGFVDRYAFWLAVRSGMSRARWRQTTGAVPVLMYHAFTDSGERDRYVVSKRRFRAQMRLLAALRYRVIPLDELIEALREHRPLPRRAVAITIDDGYRDIFEVAHPVLRRRGFPATIFLVSRRLGGSNDWGDVGAVGGRPLLSLEQIKSMGEDGIRFGAHTREHCSLPDTGDDAVVDQIAGSREDLEAVLESPVTTFAYPYGRLDRRAVRAVEDARFRGACTVEPRLLDGGSDPLLMPRVEVRGSDSIARFLRKLWFAGE
jgi:glycosyltransferase involved in cell wall biosynthesis